MPSRGASYSRVLCIAFLIAGVVAWEGCGNGNNGNGSATPTVTSAPSPVPTQAAGPGLVSEITGAEIDGGGKVTVTFSLTDGGGLPLDATLAAAQSSQQARVRFSLAHLEEYSGGGELGNTFLRYVNEINKTRPAFDRNGKLEKVDASRGIYRYTFAATLPEDFDPSLTYTVAAQVDREFDGQELSANPVHDFVPAGGSPQVRADTTTAQCNRCHAPLIAHGNRREVRLCTTCHTEAAVDEKGRSLEFRHMIHMIHAGKELPSVVDGPPGATYAIFSSFQQEDVVFAQKDADGQVTGVGFPRVLEECGVCHSDGPTVEFYRTKASTLACATCHDDVNPSLEATEAGLPPGTKHSPGAYAEGQCSACHKAEMGSEFDITVPGSHVVPERSTKLKGLNVTITGLTNHAAGEMLTISFKVTDDDGTPLRDLSALGSLTFNYTGPTTDYTTVLSGTPLGSTPSGTLVGPDADGVFQFTPNARIPETATGTWALGVEARRAVQLTSTMSVNEAAPNPVVTFAVDDSTGMPRRMVVEDERCGVCHGEFSKDFSIHGNLRNRTEYCVLCHNPTQSDVARRRRDAAAVLAGDLTGTIDFKVLIHKIHRGEALEQKPYIIYGFGPAPAGYTKNDFAEVRFPGDLRICGTCHAEDTQLIPPFPGTALPTSRTELDPNTGNAIPADPDHVAPITSVCTACHDSEDARAHAETQTAMDGTEACPVCHEEGRQFAVSVLHAGRN